VLDSLESQENEVIEDLLVHQVKQDPLAYLGDRAKKVYLD